MRPTCNLNIKERFEAKYIPEPNSGCWLWVGATGTYGYGNVTVKQESIQAHRLSYLLFKGKIPKGMWVLHKCDVRLCVNPNHLFIGTRQDNMDDMVKKNRQFCGERPYAKGSKNTQSKLTEKKVIKVRKMYKSSNFTMKELSEKFYVSKSVIHAVIHYITWKHI